MDVALRDIETRKSLQSSVDSLLREIRRLDDLLDRLCAIETYQVRLFTLLQTLLVLVGGDQYVGEIAPPPTSGELSDLRRSVTAKLDIEEFRTLCFDIGVPFDGLGGEGLAGKVRELMILLGKRDAMHLLTGWMENR